MRVEERYLITLVDAVLNGKKCENPPEKFEFKYFVNLSRAHSVDNLVYYAITRNDLIFPNDIFEGIKAGFRDHSIRYASNSAELEYVARLFDDNEIEYILLKGSIIRKLYPSPDMRTSCDVDFLCKQEDTKKIEQLMVSSGFEYTNEGDSVDSYKKFPYVSFEIHKELMGNREKFDCVKKPWERAVALENTKYGKQLCLEDFYLYMIAHTVKHFSSGGTGIRPVIDLYIFLKNYNNLIDWAYVNNTLAEHSLLKFNNELKKLSNVWFNGGTSDEFTESLTAFIINSGTFGNKSTLSAQDEIYRRKGTVIVKKVSILKVAFLSYKNMCIRYPLLNRVPILLPYYWLVRIIDVLFNKQDNLKELLNKTPKVSENEVNKIDKLLTDLEIL